MGRVPHGSAATTGAVRRAIQDSQESLRGLSRRHGINHKAVAKWKGRPSTCDLKTGPGGPHSTVLSIEGGAIIVACRRHARLPPDDCLSALQPTVSRLTRSSLHRCLQRHGIGRLADVDGNEPVRKTVKACPVGCFHIDGAEERTAEGKDLLNINYENDHKEEIERIRRKLTTRSALTG